MDLSGRERASDAVYRCRFDEPTLVTHVVKLPLIREQWRRRRVEQCIADLRNGGDERVGHGRTLLRRPDQRATGWTSDQGDMSDQGNMVVRLPLGGAIPAETHATNP